ncbi:MAG: Hsp20/alpha crystallin family protein [Clostridiales bacterium]|jgi:HSP20 family protein|nr:Hsp20/alpha crystallin family protein [Clostridiales bacterium]
MAGLIPFNRRGALNTGFHDMLDDFFNIGWPAQRSLMNDTFKMDVEEGENEYLITAELPGVAKEEINLDLTEGRLSISVKREENVNEEKKNYIHKERRVASMSRSVYLSDANTDDISAKLDNGVLHITVPKREKTQRTRKIDIL